jgi:hypothetical protein
MDNEGLLGQVMPEGIVTVPETEVQFTEHEGVPIVTPVKPVVPLHPLAV